MKTNKFEFSITEQRLLINLIKKEIEVFWENKSRVPTRHELDRLEGIMKTLKSPINNSMGMTPAGRLQALQDMLNPQDEEGNPIDSLITKKELAELLDMKPKTYAKHATDEARNKGCTCGPLKNDGSIFDGISYCCPLHGR